jgi:hypothetical protein
MSKYLNAWSYCKYAIAYIISNTTVHEELLFHNKMPCEKKTTNQGMWFQVELQPRYVSLKFCKVNLLIMDPSYEVFQWPK